MPYDENDLSKAPTFLRKLTDKLKKLWMSVFNKYLKDTGSEETAAKSAWGAVRSAQGNDAMCIGNLEIKSKGAKRIGEDEHFVWFEMIMTSPGVHNGHLKRPEDIRNILKNADMLETVENRGAIPAINYRHTWHDPLVEKENWEGFVSNFMLIDDPVHPVLRAYDYVPKSRPDIIKGLESGNLSHGSIFYFYDAIPQKGKTLGGVEYELIESNIELAHWTRSPAYGPANPEATYLSGNLYSKDNNYIVPETSISTNSTIDVVTTIEEGLKMVEELKTPSPVETQPEPAKEVVAEPAPAPHEPVKDLGANLEQKVQDLEVQVVKLTAENTILKDKAANWDAHVEGQKKIVINECLTNPVLKSVYSNEEMEGWNREKAVEMLRVANVKARDANSSIGTKDNKESKNYMIERRMFK